MSLDMKNYTGELLEEAPAAVEPQVESNSYLHEATDQILPIEQLNQGYEEIVQSEEQPSKQEMNFKALREEVDKKIGEIDQLKAAREADRKEFQLQLELLKANQAPQPAQKERKLFDNMTEDDVANVGELRRELEAREATYQARLEELEFQQTHPDYAEVLNKFLTPLIKQKPILAKAIERHPNPAAYAYELGMLAKQASEPVVASAPQKSEVAQRIVENARKPATLAQAGGQSVLSKADYYATMSDQEFMRMASKHLEGI